VGAGSCGKSLCPNSTGSVGGVNWRELLSLLEQCGAPMLPIGAGAERKGPVDPATGYGLGDWPKHPGFSASEIGSSYGPVIAAGIKTGGEARILVLDIDGVSASEWIRVKGIEPDALQTWRINRDTDPARFKLVFRLTAEQELEFPQTKLLLPTKQRDKENGIKGEAVEVYFQPGAQVVVIGAHPSSGGNYIWQGSPAEIATPDGALMALLQTIKNRVEELRGKGDTSRAPGGTSGSKGKWQGSSHRNPCPICGRDHSAACTRSTAADGAEFASCYQGSSFQPPLNLKKGETHTGHDGREWAFIREHRAEGLGWKSLFKIHTPRPQPSQPMNGEAYIPADGPSNGAAPWVHGDTAAEQQACSQRQHQTIKSKVVPGPKSGDPELSPQSERLHQPNQQEHAPKTKENQDEEFNLASCRSDWLPLVMKHVFMPNGERWISVENVLHQWNGTHYGSVADLELAPKVAKFLGRLSYYDENTGEDVHEWARPARVDEAIKWLKRQTAASIEDFNPANALNLQNGALSWSWEDQKLVIRLDPHDPAQRFTYCQGYGYDPHASRDTLDRLLRAVEDSEQDTFQRVMGSGLELARYRAIRGRPRAILAIGDGQNGKDTLQGAISETLGNRGFTHCSIGDFQQYDKGRKFPLAPLYGSRINWSSENTGYARLESIQSLKTAISGEKMSYEVKNVQEVSYSPNTLLIFNCNDAPRLDASSAAMESRWHVMAFRKRFTSHPDPNKPNELQADPRLKDDHEFIRKAVCPAMLNWLLEGLQLAVSEGISYDPDSEALEAVRRQSCHLFDFVDDVGLAADPYGEVEATYVFELLWDWYQDQRILHVDTSTKRPSWNTHDLGGDHPVKIPRDIAARLRAVFPDLRSERGTDKSRRAVLKGVRFVSDRTNRGGIEALAEARRRHGRRHEVQ
jgi:phage/plasmid-associated DNA primase